MCPSAAGQPWAREARGRRAERAQFTLRVAPVSRAEGATEYVAQAKACPWLRCSVTVVRDAPGGGATGCGRCAGFRARERHAQARTWSSAILPFFYPGDLCGSASWLVYSWCGPPSPGLPTGVEAPPAANEPSPTPASPHPPIESRHAARCALTAHPLPGTRGHAGPAPGPSTASATRHPTPPPPPPCPPSTGAGRALCVEGFFVW